MMKRGFMLIEVIIVVALVALLVVAATPGFQKSQTNATVSRVKADLRMCATALDAYAADAGEYPYDGYSVSGSPPGYNYWYLSRMLSTPVAYLQSTSVRDPFSKLSGPPLSQLNELRYMSIESTWGSAWDAFWGGTPLDSVFLPNYTTEFGEWRMVSVGPDGTYGPYGYVGVGGIPPSSLQLPYDPTNGLISPGDIIRSFNCPDGYLAP